MSASEATQIGLHEAVQAFVIFITIGLFIFFTIEYARKRATWEILWVSFVEAAVYLVATFLPTEFIPVFGPDDLPMIRYMSWMLTCPVLIKVMIASVSHDPDLVRNNKMVIADILMNSMGIFACLYRNMVVKMSLFIFGCFVAIYIIQGIFKEYDNSRRVLDQPRSRGALMVLMLLSWTIFPFLFLLGPEGAGVMLPETSVMCHSFGDLLAKNFYSFFAWSIALRSRNIQSKAAKQAALESTDWKGNSSDDAQSVRGSDQGSVRGSSIKTPMQDEAQILMVRMKQEVERLDNMKDEMQHNLRKLASMSPQMSPQNSHRQLGSRNFDSDRHDRFDRQDRDRDRDGHPTQIHF